MLKPTLLQQIEFIAGARKLVSDGNIVDLQEQNADMLKAIEENLITLRNMERAAEKKQTRIEFDSSEEPETEREEMLGDYNAKEEAERMYHIQHHLK